MKTKFTLVLLLFFTAFLTVSVFGQSAPPMMKAAVLHEAGGPENFKYEDVPRPIPKDDEILVKVIAASVNPVDTYVRQGRYKSASSGDPVILGYDIAGTVERVGAAIKSYKAGDAVYAYLQ